MGLSQRLLATRSLALAEKAVNEALTSARTGSDGLLLIKPSYMARECYDAYPRGP